jgi:NADPH2:quinone reductase
MRALVCRTLGWPQPLEVEDWPRPSAAQGQVLVKVGAAGLNFADSLLLAGTYQEKMPLPFVPGVEFCGTVVEAGADWSAGTRVMGQVVSGAYAEYVAADAHRLVPVPQGMPDAIAAGFFIPYGTAHCALVARARLRPGERLLVLGAAGAVGRACVEVGRALGAHVIGGAGGPAKLEVVRAAGAHEAIDYRAADLREQVMHATKGEGVDVVIDTVGDPLTQAALRCLRFEGRLVVLGFTGGHPARLPTNYVLVKNVDVLGVYWGPYQTRAPAATRAAFSELGEWYLAGRLHPLIAETVPLQCTADALQRLLAREIAGKVIVQVSSNPPIPS